jgi:hypothetical protein
MSEQTLWKKIYNSAQHSKAHKPQKKKTRPAAIAETLYATGNETIGAQYVADRKEYAVY